MNKLQTHKIPAWRRGAIADTVLTFDCYYGRESIFFSRVASLILTTQHSRPQTRSQHKLVETEQERKQEFGWVDRWQRISEELVKGLNINKHINILCEILV